VTNAGSEEQIILPWNLLEEIRGKHAKKRFLAISGSAGDGLGEIVSL
jgi:hypothetical protein